MEFLVTTENHVTSTFFDHQEASDYMMSLLSQGIGYSVKIEGLKYVVYLTSSQGDEVLKRFWDHGPALAYAENYDEGSPYFQKKILIRSEWA